MFALFKSTAKAASLIVILVTMFTGEVWAAQKIKNVRVWPSPDSTRVVLDLSAPIKYSYFSLKGPDRLVIDLQGATINTKLKGLAKDSKLLKVIRTSKAKKKGDSRLVLELSKKIEPMIFALKPTGPYGDRLVIDLVDSAAKVASTKKPLKQNRDIVVAIDAGHGGEDPGSIGPKGNYEKRLTFQIAKKLQNLINKEKGMTAILTRTADYYLTLHRRTEKARSADADLLISIHADAFHSPQPRGASVWVLNLKRANSEVGKWLEKREEHSQLLGGAAELIKNSNSERYLVKTLLGLSMDHSMEEAFEVSQLVVDEMKKITKLHKKRPQAANFGVLKSPDIPSILIETGFISNPEEEKLLTNNWHQNRVAKSIFTAVKSYFRSNAPEGSWFANNANLTHKVKAGESLSILAQNYSVSVTDIKQANNLKSNMLRIGQVLTIPRS